MHHSIFKHNHAHGGNEKLARVCKNDRLAQKEKDSETIHQNRVFSSKSKSASQNTVEGSGKTYYTSTIKARQLKMRKNRKKRIMVSR